MQRFALMTILSLTAATVSCTSQRPTATPPATPPAAPSAAALRVGDEGMWTLNNLPMQELKDRYNFVPTPEWVHHVQLAAVRFNNGGSGAFVSPDGLVITNHHIALDQLQKMSTPENDYVRDGFYAKTRADERRCDDLELNVLISMEEVTQRVLGAVDPEASDEQRNRQRKAEMARIEKESHDKTGLRSDVIDLYQGGEYWLYRYKKYTDVRLIMAPEFQAAFYGGDYDNFCYPRYCLDFAFFRVYEDGKPIKSDNYFKWNSAGPKEGELVFVAGNPGSTSRLLTVAQLQYQRDYGLPMSLNILKARRVALREYAARGPEQARQIVDDIDSVENSIKAIQGEYEGLKDPAIFDHLAANERMLRQQVAARPDLARSVDSAWDHIAAAMAKSAERRNALAYYALRGSDLVGIARTITRYVVEIQKPNDQRYEEYRDSARESLDLQLFSPAPIYPALEEQMLASALAEALKNLGPDDKLVKAALGGRDPKTVAHELISGTKLADPAVRKALVAGGVKAVDESTDPLIVFARRLDPIWRELRDWQENNIQSVLAIDGGKIAQARFAVYGRNTYPDATFTLRLSFGRVAGYELDTTLVPWKTTFLGLFDRAASFDNKPPFELSAQEARNRGKIDMDTPLNFVTTNDIVGGNSGSPVFNKDLEYVGLIFDGNIQSLVLDYVYTDKVARAVAVHSAAIVEALRDIYNMPDLVRELTEKQ